MFVNAPSSLPNPLTSAEMICGSFATSVGIARIRPAASATMILTPVSMMKGRLLTM